MLQLALRNCSPTWIRQLTRQIKNKRWSSNLLLATLNSITSLSNIRTPKCRTNGYYKTRRSKYFLGSLLSWLVRQYSWFFVTSLGPNGIGKKQFAEN
jgi:hypothetical protein